MAGSIQVTDHKPGTTSIVLAYAAIYLVWGSTYLAIRFAVETLPPFLMLFARFFTAGLSSHFFTDAARSWINTPSPRFSTAGNHWGSSAIWALSTSVSYSPLMSGVTGSSRVKPARAWTSRSR